MFEIIKVRSDLFSPKKSCMIIKTSVLKGLATFLPKLMQNQFSLSESEAAVNVGVVSVVAGGGGTLLGGIICKKFRLKVGVFISKILTIKYQNFIEVGI